MKSYNLSLIPLGLVIVALFSCGQTVEVRREPLSLTKVPGRLVGTLPVTSLPDPAAEYGIITDMDGDGFDEWVLVFFAGTDEVIDHYAVTLFEKRETNGC